YNDIISNNNITLYTGTSLIECNGSKGDFKAKLKIQPRYVKSNANKDSIHKAIEVCPVVVPDEFDFNITNRKAIYHNFPSEYPQAAVIDMKNCTKCGECEKVSQDIDLGQKEEIVDIRIGTILVATGFDPYTPNEGEYGFQAFDNVITLPQFKRLVANSKDEIKWKNKTIKNISYIYCVGSRQAEGDNKYCSRFCCTTTIYSALKASEKFANTNHFHFTRGVRTYGKQEEVYAKSLKSGQVFFQCDDDNPAIVEQKKGKTIVKASDILSKRADLEVETDLVVLVTGMVPRAESNISEILKIPKGRDNFFNEIHMKLRPVETVIDGVTIAGACQGPKNVVESINSALSASIKSYSFVRTEKLAIEPIIAEIDPNICSWCNACTAACPFDAIIKKDHNGKTVAEINATVCKGCGMCLPVCQPNAIQLKTFSDNEIELMIDVLANDL
ncbi:MAG: CoB--CoM heterodisulfide reductase iron-sulfur subunit A family protein, partial [Sphingobacteriia bacterium]|nr:CoB--CoM heterodisulfide reductase iron-sulfur subunit A family protein [Sphingobacteriia bacterium]